MSEQVVISSGDLTARIDPLGAELVSLTDASGAEWLTDADPAFWTGHAPLLFPIVGRLNGDALRVDGREYPMKQHGFARKSVWQVEAQAAANATFLLADSPETRAVYPFTFALRVQYALAGATLAITANIANSGDVPLPFSFGFHPAFAWPLPGGGEKEAHTIEFEFPEPDVIRRLDEAGLLSGLEPTPVRNTTLALHSELFAADALIWEYAMSRCLTYRGENGVALEIAFPGMPFLGIWQKPGANFICIEPWQGHADPAGYSGEFAAKPGIVTLLPGEERSFRMDVTLHHG
jgi:galactose mutarotase-like enzyme